MIGLILTGIGITVMATVGLVMKRAVDREEARELERKSAPASLEDILRRLSAVEKAMQRGGQRSSSQG